MVMEKNDPDKALPEYWVTFLAIVLARIATTRDIQEARMAAQAGIKAILRSGYSLTQDIRDKLTKALVDEDPKERKTKS